MSDVKYENKERARGDVQSAIETYLSAADVFEMGAQETADELTDIFVNLGQPYKVTTE